jgi:hypothetical protein
MIPRAGLGLFVTQDFLRGDFLDLEYLGTEITKTDFDAYCANVNQDEHMDFVDRYLIQMTKNGPYYDGTNGGSILRFINISPCASQVNCKFVRKGRVGHYRWMVEITKNVYDGNELLLVYNSSAEPQYHPSTNETEKAIEQRIAILNSLECKE